MIRASVKCKRASVTKVMSVCNRERDLAGEAGGRERREQHSKGLAEDPGDPSGAGQRE